MIFELKIILRSHHFDIYLEVDIILISHDMQYLWLFAHNYSLSIHSILYYRPRWMKMDKRLVWNGEFLKILTIYQRWVNYFHLICLRWTTSRWFFHTMPDGFLCKERNMEFTNQHVNNYIRHIHCIFWFNNLAFDFIFRNCKYSTEIFFYFWMFRVVFWDPINQIWYQSMQ